MRKYMLVGLFTVFALTGAAQTARAAECATDLLECYERAAREEGFWARWAAGLDCELDFVECARIKIVGG
jgi:hypothetical protein